MSGIRLDNTQYLLELVEKARMPLRAVIDETYSKHALAYTETLAFLIALDVLRAGRTRILLGKNFPKALDALTKGGSEYAKFLLELVVTSNSEYGAELRRVFLTFSGHAASMSMPRLGPRDPRYAARDTLVSAGVVVVDHDTGVATLRPEYYRLYALAHCYRGPSPDELLDSQLRQRDIGHRAELAVLTYERQLVGSRYANQVVHVSQHSASAGFDIASLRVATGDRSLESRLIEVKAVRRDDLGFFWSSQEVKVARAAGDSYFLYLVPVRGGEPAVEELVVVRDPAQRLLDRPSIWDVQGSEYYCRRRLSDGA